MNQRYEVLIDIAKLALEHAIEHPDGVGDGAKLRTMMSELEEMYAAARIRAGEEVIRTKTGKVMTETDFERLADEAERGYDVEHLRNKPNRRAGTS